MSFEALGAHPTLLRALAAKGYDRPTPVQEACLAGGLERRDLLVSAETGSGKTVAFGLSLAHTLLGEHAGFDAPGAPRALVLAPTRELALQVQRELHWLYAPAGMRSVACVGGMGMHLQLRMLDEGVHLVVGTPGRLCDHLERGALSLESLQALVLDEADEMLDMGFREELERILEAAPAARRTLMFSATLPPDIVSLSGKWLRDPVRVTATPPRQAHRDIEHRAHVIALREREHAVVNVLRAHDPPAAIVFCATRESVNHLAASLGERGFACVAISGELSQPERTRALQALRDGRARVLVATDVAARGLDLPDVSLVVQADLPHDAQGLQHRAGRTGRAGKKGVAVLLVPYDRRRLGERLLREVGVQATWSEVPDAKSIRGSDRRKVVEALTTPQPVEDDDLAVAREVLAQVSAEEIAARLVALERAKLPEPEDLPLTAAALAAEARGDRTNRRYEPRSTRAWERDRGAPPPRSFGAERPPPTGPGPGWRPRFDEGGGSGSSAWYVLNVGRQQNADPRWIVPALCRRGGITKDDIGAIRIFEHETRVEILGGAIALFEDRATKPDRVDPRLVIRPDRGAPRGHDTHRGAVRRGK